MAANVPAGMTTKGMSKNIERRVRIDATRAAATKAKARNLPRSVNWDGLLVIGFRLEWCLSATRRRK